MNTDKLGMGAMLHILGGGSPHSADEYYEKEIKSAKLKDDIFFISFKDGVKIELYDNAQSCCEHRYMTCDDNLKTLKNTVLKSIEVSHGEGPSEYGDHEIAFVKIITDKSYVTLETHNEHNGYYGGFGLSIREVDKE